MTTRAPSSTNLPHGREPDARAAPGDDGDLAVEASCHGALLLSVTQWAMKTFFSSVNAFGASGPSSRPRPLCL